MVFLATSLSKPAVKQPEKHEVRVCEAAPWKEKSGIWKGGCKTAGKARSASLRSAHSLKQVKSEMLLMRNGRKNARK